LERVGVQICSASRSRATDSVLGHASKAIEIQDIQSRVTALEQALEESAKKNK
jgi:hypothetical protein